MKVVAVFVVACIAVALAYPYDDWVMKFQHGNKVVYNEELDQREKEQTPVHVQFRRGNRVVYNSVCVGCLKSQVLS